VETLVGWASLNPATAFWAALGLFTTVVGGAGVAFSRTFRQSCNDFAAARWQEAKDVARLVAYILIAPLWLGWKIWRLCQWLHPKLQQRSDRYYLIDHQHRFAIGMTGVLVVSGFMWVACAVLGVRLPHGNETVSSAVMLTSTEDWLGGKLDGVQVRNGSLELQRVSGGEWKSVSDPMTDYTDILPLGDGTALLAVDLMPYVVYYDGHQEHREGLPKGKIVRYLARADNRIFGFGNDGQILERLNRKWTPVGAPIVPNYAGTAYAKNEIVAVGGGGFIAHYRRGEWGAEELPAVGTSNPLVGTLDDGTFVAAVGGEVFYCTAQEWQAVTPTLKADRGEDPVSIIGVAGEDITRLVVATSTQILRRQAEGWLVDKTPLANCPPPDGNLVSIGDTMWYGASVGQSVRLLDGAWTTIPLPKGSQGIGNLRPDGKDIWGIARQTLGATILRFQDEVQYVDHGTAVYHVSGDNVKAWGRAELHGSVPNGTIARVEYSADGAVWMKDPPRSGSAWVRITLGSNDKTKTPSVQRLQVEPAPAERS